MYASKFAPGSCSAVIGTEIQATWLTQCQMMGYRSLEKCCDENMKCMSLTAVGGKNGKDQCHALILKNGNCYAISTSAVRNSFLNAPVKGDNLAFTTLGDTKGIETNP